MLMNTLRNQPWFLRTTGGLRTPGRQRFPQAVYWRRRAVALIVALAILSLIAWAFFGALGLAAGSPAESHGVAARDAAGAGQPGGGQAGGTAPGGTHSQAPAVLTAPSPSARPGAPARRCPRASIVLSLIPPAQAAYTGTQLPQLTIAVVSTVKSVCSFDVGARHLRLMISSGGVRVWSSADCATGAGSLVTNLERGVPAMLSITWDRQSSRPGCTAPAAAMPAGTYTATVTDGTLQSNPVSFRLG